MARHACWIISWVALCALPPLAVADVNDLPRTYPSMVGVAALKGVALMADGVTPWAGAHVDLHWYANLPPEKVPPVPPFGNSGDWQAQAGKDGTFQFRALPPGRYWLRVSDWSSPLAEGRPERSTRLDIEPGQKAAQVRIVMSALELTGQVVTEEGGPPVPGAQVMVLRVGPSGRGGHSVAELQADADGRFRVRNLEPGHYSVRASLTREDQSAFQGEGVPVTLLEAGLAEPMTVPVKPKTLYTVSGVVRDAEGKPVSGARVVLGHRQPKEFGNLLPHPPESAPGAQVVRTDADGRYTFADLAKSQLEGLWLNARGPNGSERSVRPTVGYPPKSLECDLQLTECAIAGSVTRAADGKPVGGVTVEQRQLDVPHSEAWGPFAVVTDERGLFRLGGCTPGSHELLAKEGQQPIARATVTVEPEQEASVSLVVHDTLVSGTVVRPDGTPVSGAHVRAEGLPQVATDNQGRFELRGVLPGKARLVAKENRNVRRVEIMVREDRATEGAIVLPDYVPLVRLKVLTPGGTPAAGLPVRGYKRVEAADRTGYGLFRKSPGADGVVSDQVPGGGYVAYLAMIPGVGCSEPGRVEVGGLEREVEHVVQLKPAGTISGTVKEQGTGRPVGGVMVTPYQVRATENEAYWAWNAIYDAGYGSAPSLFPSTASREGDGTFTLDPIPAGTYDLHVWDLFRHEQKVRVEIGEAQHLTGLEIIVPRHDDAMTLSGVILDPNGRPAANREVELRVWATSRWEPDTPEFFEGEGKIRRFGTNAQGRFTLDPMPPGKWLISPGGRSAIYCCGVVVSTQAGPVAGVKIRLPSKDVNE
jgi:protocatechuate 3,4-dioxygenase beta subunit